MALTALGDAPVFFTVTISTGHFCGVLARKVLYLTPFFGVTKGACGGRLFHWDTQWLVGISMTGQTRDQILVVAVERPATPTLVAPDTIGHNLVEVLLARTVHVELSMATHALDPVPESLFSQRVKDRDMAPGAVLYAEGLYFLLIGGMYACRSRLLCLHTRWTDHFLESDSGGPRTVSLFTTESKEQSNDHNNTEHSGYPL